MADEPQFLDLDEVLELHAQSLAEHGGADGLRDRGLIESAVTAARNVYYYEAGDLFDIAAAYAYHIGESQAFLDGNKRTGVASALTFLDLNGIRSVPEDAALYDAMIAIAEKRMRKSDLAALFRDSYGSAGGQFLQDASCRIHTHRNTRYSPQGGPTHIELPHSFPCVTGILPLPSIMDMTVGEEVVLIWRDTTLFAAQLAKQEPFALFLTSGMFRSEHGLVVWLIFHATDGEADSKPHAVCECFIDPESEKQVAIWEGLAGQSHWHLAILDAAGNLLRMREFQNNFGLETVLSAARGMRGKLESHDFNLAKRDFMNQHEPQALLRAAINT